MHPHRHTLSQTLAPSSSELPHTRLRLQLPEGLRAPKYKTLKTHTHANVVFYGHLLANTTRRMKYAHEAAFKQSTLITGLGGLGVQAHAALQLPHLVILQYLMSCREPCKKKKEKKAKKKKKHPAAL